MQLALVSQHLAVMNATLVATSVTNAVMTAATNVATTAAITVATNAATTTAVIAATTAAASKTAVKNVNGGKYLKTNAAVTKNATVAKK